LQLLQGGDRLGEGQYRHLGAGIGSSGPRIELSDRKAEGDGWPRHQGRYETPHGESKAADLGLKPALLWCGLIESRPFAWYELRKSLCSCRRATWRRRESVGSHGQHDYRRARWWIGSRMRHQVGESTANTSRADAARPNHQKTAPLTSITDPKHRDNTS
jgi:hypothetical protein